MKKNLFAFIFICYGLFSAIGFSEAQSPIDTSPTAITSNPWSPPENGGAGWYPQISSNGRYVAYATANINSDPTISNHIWVNDLQTNTARDITPAGVGGCYSPHWISESRVTFFCDNGSNGSNSIRFEASAPDFSSTATTDSPNLVGGNAFSASGGNWASWGFNRLTWNNQIIRNNTGGNLDVSGNRLIISCTNQNNSICLYQSGRPAGTFTPQTRIYGMSINSGYIVYGGRGPVRGITPGGNDVNLTASQFEEGNGEVVTVNGAPWVVTTAYDRANDQGYILFRPWGMRDSIILRAPANNIAVAYDAASNSFIVAYNTDRGSLTTLRVDANSPRRDISGGIPPESGLDPNAVGFASSSFIPVPTTEMDFGQLIQFIINYSFYVVGIAIFGVMFWAGFTWFTAAGNSSKINEAKGKIYNAIIGAILLSSAYVLLYTINPDLVGGTFTLEPIAQSESNGATTPHRCAGTPGTADYRGALLSAIQATIARNTEGIADLPNTRDNVMRFLGMVVAEIETGSLEATETVLNGGGNPNRGDIIAVWAEGDALMERYDVIQDAGGGSSIRNTIQANLVGHIPLDCTY